MQRSRMSSGLWFLLPGLVGFCLFYLLPFGISLGYSLYSRPVNGVFVGLRNYTELLNSPTYRLGLWNTVRFIGVSVPVGTALSLVVALGVHRLRDRREWISLLFLVPLVVPSGSLVAFWTALFDYEGHLNGILYGAGIAPVRWLESGWAFWVLVAIFLWKNVGYNMVLFLAGLSNVPREHREAAWVDGARGWAVLWRITLPQLLPTSVLVATLSVVNSFRVFREIYLLTGNYPHESIYTLQHYLNNQFAALSYPKLTAATAVLVAAVAAVTQGLLRVARGVEE